VIFLQDGFVELLPGILFVYIPSECFQRQQLARVYLTDNSISFYSRYPTTGQTPYADG
jgi:hypothetical protein